MLNKEFKEKDVERLRNIIKGKHGDKTSIGIGYTKNEEFHKEGDIWEEDGRKWTIKDGVKQKLTKLDGPRLDVFMEYCKPSYPTLALLNDLELGYFIQQKLIQFNQGR